MQMNLSNFNKTKKFNINKHNKNSKQGSNNTNTTLKNMESTLKGHEAQCWTTAWGNI